MCVAQMANIPIPDCYSVPFSGAVLSDPVYNPETERIVCEFRLDMLDGTEFDEVVRLYLRSDELPLAGIEYGQQLECFGHVWPQDNATNPYQFDSRKWLLSAGVNGMAAAKLEDTIVVSSANFDLETAIILIRNAISGRIDSLFPKNAELVKAFVLGDRTGLDSELRDAFSKTGAAHLIAISGMHISVLAAAISSLLSRWLKRNTAVITTLAIVFLYGLLIGFPASLVRASIMFAFLSIGTLLGEPSDAMTRLSGAFLCMVLVHPFYIYSSGFVLSFSASAGIILLESPISRLFGVDRLKHLKPHPKRLFRILQKLTIYFPQLLCTTLAAQLATLPAVIAYFGAQSLLSLPVNLIAIPLAMTAYPLSLAVLLLSVIFPPLGMVLAVVPEMMFSSLSAMVTGLSAIQIGRFRIPEYPAFLLLIHFAMVFGASDLGDLKERARSIVAASLPFLTIAALTCAWIGSIPCRVIFFDAGQADAAILRAGGHNYLFDVGDVYSPVTDYVSAACTGIDAVFLSHPHYDHAGGLASLLTTVKPEVIYVPEGWFEVDAAETVREGIDRARELNIPILEMRPEENIALSKNVHVTAHKTINRSINDMSLLLEVQCGETGFLFTGDMTMEGEPETFPDIDVLKVPHHGSSKATSEHMLMETSPDVSIISVGDNNYGHPSDQTLEHIAKAESEIYRTDHHGAITLWVLPEESMHIQTFLTTEDES